MQDRSKHLKTVEGASQIGERGGVEWTKMICQFLLKSGGGDAPTAPVGATALI